MRTNAELTGEALAIFEACLDAVDPYAAVTGSLSSEGSWVTVTGPDGGRHGYDLDQFERIYVVGAGKATARMAQAVEHVIGGRLTQGLIVVKYGHGAGAQASLVVEAGHPVPDAHGLSGTKRILTLADGLGPKDLIFVLISGGASALLPLPADGISLADKRAITQALIGAGADIGELNAVRKHLSAVKGGQLTRRAFPGTVVTLALSDVVGDRLDTIGSGPTVPDASTFAEAWSVLDSYGLLDRAPSAVRERLARGRAGEVAETPKAGETVFERAVHVVVASNRKALDACEGAARARGWNTAVLASTIEGEARDIAGVHAALAREIRETGRPLPPPACLISGGETTVRVRGTGRGGRNQEQALAAAVALDGLEGVAIFSGGTDGTDGPTDAAGGIAFGDSVARARAAGLEARQHLRNNDAYSWLAGIGDLVKTGPTGTNVMDIHLVLVSA